MCFSDPCPSLERTSSDAGAGESGISTYQRTLVAGLVAGLDLVTPAGLAALVLGAALGLVVVLRLVTGAVSTVSKTRGLELPVCERVPSRGMMTNVWWWWWAKRGGEYLRRGKDMSFRMRQK